MIYLQTSRKQLVPVLVFIHGGAFVSGSGDRLIPGNLMDSDVVVVSFNYRLGVFGECE